MVPWIQMTTPGARFREFPGRPVKGLGAAQARAPARLPPRPLFFSGVFAFSVELPSPRRPRARGGPGGIAALVSEAGPGVFPFL